MGLLSSNFVTFSVVCTLILLLQGSIANSLPKKVLRHHRCSIGENKVELMDDFLCKPRLQVVSIPKRQPHDVFRPSSVEIKRCSGGCANMRNCTAKVVDRKCVLVYDEIKEVYEYLEVEEHVECSCCDITKDTCNEKQKFLAKECICKCIDEAEEEECTLKNRVWDHSNCHCMCPEEICLSSEKLSQETCSCQAIKHRNYFA